MTKVRDIAAFLGKTEALNPINKSLAFDSNSVTTLTPSIANDIISANGVVVYDSVGLLPASPNDGDRAWVTSNNRFYIADSSWHNALLVNAPPTITILNYDSAPSDSASFNMTIQVSDSFENTDIITFGATISPLNITDSAVLTFSRDSSVIALAINPDSANSTANTFSITFTANDQVNLSSTTKTFTIDRGFVLTPTDVYVSSLLSSTTTRVYVDSDVTDIFQDGDVINDNNDNDATITDITMENLTLRGTESTSLESTSSIIYSDADLTSTVSSGQIIAASNVITSGNLGRDEAGYTRYGEVNSVTYNSASGTNINTVTNSATYHQLIWTGTSFGYLFQYNGTYFSTGTAGTTKYYHDNPSTATVNTSYLWPFNPSLSGMNYYLVGTYAYLNSSSGGVNNYGNSFSVEYANSDVQGTWGTNGSWNGLNGQHTNYDPGANFTLTVSGNKTAGWAAGDVFSFGMLSSLSNLANYGQQLYMYSAPVYNSGSNTTTIYVRNFFRTRYTFTTSTFTMWRMPAADVIKPNFVYWLGVSNDSVSSPYYNFQVPYQDLFYSRSSWEPTRGATWRPYRVDSWTSANTAIGYTHAGTSPGSGTLISNGGQIYTGNPTTRLTVDAGGTQFGSGERIYLKT